MKPAVLLFQILIVGAGIFVYDALRTPTAPPVPTGSDEDYVARRDNPSDGSPEEAPVVTLEGADVDARLAAANRKISTLQGRLEAMERTLSALRASGASGSSGSASPGTSAPTGGWTPTGSAGLRDVDPDNPVFEDSELGQFRSYLEAVEAQRRDERFVTMIEGQLDRLGISLAGEERQRVVKATIDYRQKVRETLRASASGGEEARQERTRAMEALRESYSEQIFQIAPSAEAEKIIQGVGRYPGMGATRLGGNR